MVRKAVVRLVAAIVTFIALTMALAAPAASLGPIGCCM